MVFVLAQPLAAVLEAQAFGEIFGGDSNSNKEEEHVLCEVLPCLSLPIRRKRLG